VGWRTDQAGWLKHALRLRSLCPSRRHAINIQPPSVTCREIKKPQNEDVMSVAEWALLIGVLLLVMTLTGTLLQRLPLSSPMVYLALGWVLGPQVAGVLLPDPYVHVALLERLAELALLISVFSVGLRLEVPLRDARWRLPLRLAFVSMTAMVAMVAALGVWVLGLSLGASILLGAILAPTDPVLASDVSSDPGARPDRLGFSLAGEGALNDGSAFPFVMLGLGLLGVHELGPNLARWWAVDVLWAIAGGLLAGAAVGTATGRLVVWLRSRHAQAVGLDEFLGLGVVGMAYGLAHISLASGLLAVFAAGMALQHVHERPRANTKPLPAAASSEGHSYEKLATHSHHASATMRLSVQGFNEQLEKFAEMALVLMVGAMLAYTRPMPAAWWFVPVVLLVLRPLSAVLSTAGEGLTRPQSAMICWFGIRGIGSIFYVLFAVHHGLAVGLTDTLLTLTLWTVAASIVAHGITAQPLMARYLAWRAQWRDRRGLRQGFRRVFGGRFDAGAGGVPGPTRLPVSGKGLELPPDPLAGETTGSETGRTPRQL
jgi:sodium/hydrogen antiporter